MTLKVLAWTWFHALVNPFLTCFRCYLWCLRWFSLLARSCAEVVLLVQVCSSSWCVCTTWVEGLVQAWFHQLVCRGGGEKRERRSHPRWKHSNCVCETSTLPPASWHHSGTVYTFTYSILEPFKTTNIDLTQVLWAWVLLQYSLQPWCFWFRSSASIPPPIPPPLPPPQPPPLVLPVHLS